MTSILLVEDRYSDTDFECHNHNETVREIKQF